MGSANWDEYFGTRRWRVATEVTGTDVVFPGTLFHKEPEEIANPVQVRFTKGKFEIDGGVFHSPLSSARGTKGYLLQEVDAEHVNGPDIPDSTIAVGVVVYRRAKREGAIR